MAGKLRWAFVVLYTVTRMGRFAVDDSKRLLDTVKFNQPLDDLPAAV